MGYSKSAFGAGPFNPSKRLYNGHGRGLREFEGLIFDSCRNRFSLNEASPQVGNEGGLIECPELEAAFGCPVLVGRHGRVGMSWGMTCREGLGHHGDRCTVDSLHASCHHAGTADKFLGCSSPLSNKATGELPCLKDTAMMVKHTYIFSHNMNDYTRHPNPCFHVPLWRFMLVQQTV